MNTKQPGSRFGLLAVITAGLCASTVRADIIAGDAFNYTPVGASLAGANGGSPSSAGWDGPNVALFGSVTVAAGLNYTTPYGIGLGNSALVGTDSSSGQLSRDIAAHTMPTDYWIRALYNPGANNLAGETTLTPFQFQGINGGGFSVDHAPSALDGSSSMFLNIQPMNAPEVDPGEPTAPVAFPLTPGTHILLWHINVDPAAGANDELRMWLDPTALTVGALGTSSFIMEGDFLGNSEGYSDFLAAFSSLGAGDIIDELVIGSSFADAISQLSDPVTSVPEVSGPVMMAMVGLLGGGVVWYRRRQKAVA